MPKTDTDKNIDLDLPLPFQIAQLNSMLNAQARKIISRYGELSLAQWRILHLVAWDIAETTTAVRKAIGIDKGQFSKALSHLVGQSYVELSTYAGDKRQYQIRLTEKGMSMHASIKPELMARRDHLLASLSLEEQNTLYRAISLLAQAAQKTDFTD